MGFVEGPELGIRSVAGTKLEDRRIKYALGARSLTPDRVDLVQSFITPISETFVKTIARFLVVTAWAAMIAVVYATLAHANVVNDIYLRLAPLLMRPDRVTYGFIVHILAFAALGTLFTLAYPRRLVLVCSIVFGGAVALEALQTVTQDRHGTVIDVLEKLAGGLAGIAVGRATAGITERRDTKVHATVPTNELGQAERD